MFLLLVSMTFIAVACTAVGVFRLGNILVTGFNQHTRAMQALYDEMGNRSGKPSGTQ